jgi:hypothetical protein
MSRSGIAAVSLLSVSMLAAFTAELIFKYRNGRLIEVTLDSCEISLAAFK